jgi:hypothetical protein
MGMRVSGSLEGHALWAFEKFCAITGKSPGPALATIIERWTEHDGLAKQHSLTLEDYRRETQGAEVVQLATVAQKKVR